MVSATLGSLLCGKLVGTTSDIYSLGVLLYELLAGRLPFDFASATAGEIERILTEHDPPKPSAAAAMSVDNPSVDNPSVDSPGEPAAAEVARARVLSPRELPRRLAGDLDAIVMKALRSAPQRRYASAGRFADDVRRFERNLPVSARQGGWPDRVGKLVRRHRVATAVAASLAIALAVGAGAMASKHAEVLRERDVAELERSRRETVLALLLDVLQVADPNVSRGETFTIREALEASAPKLRRQLADQPALGAELLHTTGTIYHNLGLWSRARVDLEEALSLRRGLFGEHHESVARTQSRLALVLANLGETEAAQRLSASATHTVRRPDGELAKEDVAFLNNRVTVLCAAHDYETALPLAIEALGLARGTPNSSELPTALINRAMVALQAGDNIHAAELFRQSADLLALRYGNDHPRLVNPLSNLGSARRRAGDLTGAQAAFEETLAIQRATLGDRHPTLAITFNNLAGIFAARGDHEQAIEMFHQAARVFKSQAGSDHPRLFFLETQIARARIDAGEPGVAAIALRQSIANWRERIGAEHRFSLLAELALGRALTAIGDFEAAEGLLTASFERALAQGWQRDADHSLEDLRVLYEAMGTPEKAGAFAKRLEQGSDTAP